MKILFMAIALIAGAAFSKEVKWEELQGLSVKEEKGKSIPEVKGDTKKLVGKEIEIKGFMLPLDYEAKDVAEFLLVPYIPSCMHVPPPPANQVIYVRMDKGSKVKASYYPVLIKGVLGIESVKNDFMESGWNMTAKNVKEIK
jgi:hypothetical protein